MEENDIINEIRKVFLSTFPELQNQGFDLQKKQEDFENWDSFSHLELVEKVESQFNLKFDFNEIVELNSAHKFVDKVRSKITG